MCILFEIIVALLTIKKQQILKPFAVFYLQRHHCTTKILPIELHVMYSSYGFEFVFTFTKFAILIYLHVYYFDI